MRSNGLLKWLMLPVALLAVFVGIRFFSGERSAPPAPRETGRALSADEMKALGVEGDTPRDTVATLVAQVRQLRKQLQSAVTTNRNQQTENEQLRRDEQSINQRIQGALDAERAQLREDHQQVENQRQQTQSLLQTLQHRIDDLGSAPVQAELPVGLGLKRGDGQRFGSADAMHWIEPGDAKRVKSPIDHGGFSFPNDFGPADGTTDFGSKPPGGSDNTARTAGSSRAVYTVPSNSTLMGSIAMTALIGRIPIDGTVNDPYPFKVLIGPDNLTANGIELPDIEGAVVSGTASGDWTLSCVRGRIRSITFVFHDGTIRTIPKDAGRSGAGGGQGNTRTTQGGLGWISDPYGIPCVSGQRRSNAQQYLGTQALVTAAGAGAASLIDSPNGRVSYINSDGSLGTVGITGNEAMGRVLAGGVQAMSQWVNKLYGQAFAAIYVPPGAEVAVHIERPLTIDYDSKGRKVNYDLGGSHVSDLD